MEFAARGRNYWLRLRSDNVHQHFKRRRVYNGIHLLITQPEYNVSHLCGKCNISLSYKSSLCLHLFFLEQFSYTHYKTVITFTFYYYNKSYEPGYNEYNETSEYTLYRFWHSKLSQTCALVCCATNIKLVWNIYVPPT